MLGVCLSSHLVCDRMFFENIYAYRLLYMSLYFRGKSFLRGTGQEGGGFYLERPDFAGMESFFRKEPRITNKRAVLPPENHSFFSPKYYKSGSLIPQS